MPDILTGHITDNFVLIDRGEGVQGKGEKSGEGSVLHEVRFRQCDNLTDMSWIEKRIRRYEHRRWTEDDNRRVRPFDWGLEHVGLSGNGANSVDPRSALGGWAEHTVAHSEEWFHTEPAGDYVLHPSENSARAENHTGAENGARAENGGHGDRVLTFSSAVDSPWPENNRVHARLFAVSHS